MTTPQTALAPERRRDVLRQSWSVGVATGAYGVSFGALSVAAGLDVLQTQALSTLMFTGGSQFDELRFDSLRTVGRSFQISNTRKLERFAVDALLSVQDGDFVVRDNANSGGITFPALGAVAGSIIIRDNPKMPTDSLMNELSDVESSGPPLVCGNLGGDPCP